MISFSNLRAKSVQAEHKELFFVEAKPDLDVIFACKGKYKILNCKQKGRLFLQNDINR